MKSAIKLSLAAAVRGAGSRVRSCNQAAAAATLLPAVALLSRHPKASREVVLQGSLVAYEFQRSQRRTIGFTAGPHGLSVRAPRWASLREVEQALLAKSAWIIKKLHQTQQSHRTRDAARLQWKDGTLVPFMGLPITLVLARADVGVGVVRLAWANGQGAACTADGLSTAGARAAGAQPEEGGGTAGTASEPPQKVALLLPAGHQLLIGLPADAPPEGVQAACEAWLRQQARELLTERLNHFAPVLGVHWRKLSLSSARTRWGSANVNGAIRLNWRLIHLSPALIDYVVVHELSHLRVMDHSPRFWQAVGDVLPNYADLRRQLRTEITVL